MGSSILIKINTLMRDMGCLLDSASVFAKANAEGEKWEKANPDTQNPDLTQGEQPPKDKASEDKASEEEPHSKRLKFLIPNPSTKSPTPLSSIMPQNMTMGLFTDSLFRTTLSEYSLTPPKDKNKGKGIATEEEPMKLLMPLIEQGGSDPTMLNLYQFSISGKNTNLEDAQAQLIEMKKLDDLKAE
ncbi:hypothetical protein Tco_0571750 [Tanacetum coccineum]